MAKMTPAQLSSLLNTEVTQDAYEAAGVAVDTAIQAELPSWCGDVSTLTLAENIARVESVWNRVVIRVLTNPAATQSAGVEGLTTTFPYVPGSSLSLMPGERKTLASLVPETPTGQSSSVFSYVQLEW